MGRYGIGFNAKGRFTTFPEVFVNINADNLDLRPVSPLGIVAILAQGAGFFTPQVATSLPFQTGSPQRFIPPSDLLTAAEFAVKPFAELDRGAGEVIVVPVNASTPATMDLETSGAAVLATLTSKGWGTKFNEIQVKHETLKLTLTLPTPTSAVLEVFVYDTVANLVTAVNERSSLCSAALTTEGTIANFSYTAMAGGTEPTATTADWDTALHALDGRRITSVAICDPDPVVWAMLSDYAIMKRLRGFVGGEIQSWNGSSARQIAIAALKSDAATLNAFRMMHVGLGMNGEPGYLSAARYAGLAAALEPSVPMTFKHLDVTSLEARLDIPTEVGGIDGLLLAGVAVPVPDPSSPSTYLVSRGLSTWTGDDNLYRREHSVLAAVDAIQDQIESGMRQFLGNEGTVGVIKRAMSLVNQILFEATRPRAVVRINSYRPESIHAEFSGSDTVLHITAALTPIPPINFVDVTLNLERTEIVVDFDVNLNAT